MSGFLLGIAALNPAYASTQPTVHRYWRQHASADRRQRQCCRRKWHSDPLAICHHSTAGNRQHGHDLDRIAWEDREMRVPFEYAGGGFVRVRAHDREGAEFIGDVADSTCGNLLRAAQWPAHRDDGGLMLLGPSLPGRHA